MAYAHIADGTPTSGFNTAISPAMPTGYSAGNLLLLHTGVYQGAGATPTVTGWTLLSPGTLANQVALFGRIATGSDTASISWGNQFAFAMVSAYSGNPTTLTGIVHASVDYLHTSVNAMQYQALTITQPGCLVLAAFGRDKTATSNGVSIFSLSGFTLRNSITLTGTSIMGGFNDQIQTTATNLTASNQSFGVSEVSAVQYELYTVALLPLASSTLTAASGSYSLAGQAVTFPPPITNYVLLAATGIYNDTGAMSGSDFTIDAIQGAYGVTGSDANLLAFPAGAYGIAAQPGNYATVGQAATLSTSQVLVPVILTAAAGSYAYTGYAAQFPITVPNFLGLTQAQAIALAALDGLTITSLSSVYNDQYAPGIIAAQSPNAGATLNGPYNVQLAYSLGPIVVPPAAPLPPLKVTTRSFSLEEMVAREWGSSFRAPDHRIYTFAGRGFDSTDIGFTGIYGPPGTLTTKQKYTGET